MERKVYLDNGVETGTNTPIVKLVKILGLLTQNLVVRFEINGETFYYDHRFGTPGERNMNLGRLQTFTGSVLLTDYN